MRKEFERFLLSCYFGPDRSLLSSYARLPGRETRVKAAGRNEIAPGPASSGNGRCWRKEKDLLSMAARSTCPARPRWLAAAVAASALLAMPGSGRSAEKPAHHSQRDALLVGVNDYQYVEPLSSAGKTCSPCRTTGRLGLSWPATFSCWRTKPTTTRTVRRRPTSSGS